MKILAVFFVLLVFPSPTYSQAKRIYTRTLGYKPDAGFLPDSETALSVGKLIIERIYPGDKGKFLYTAELTKEGVWLIKSRFLDTTLVGGGPYLELLKSDSRVIKLVHGM